MLDSEETVFLPVAPVDRIDVHICEVDVVLRDVNLDVFTGLEVDILSFRKLDGELFYKGCDVLVGNNFAFEFLDAEGALRNRNPEIVLNLDLAAESPAVFDLLAGEEACFGREDGASAFDDSDFALSAVCLSTAG